MAVMRSKLAIEMKQLNMYHVIDIVIAALRLATGTDSLLEPLVDIR